MAKKDEDKQPPPFNKKAKQQNTGSKNQGSKDKNKPTDTKYDH